MEILIATTKVKGKYQRKRNRQKDFTFVQIVKKKNKYIFCTEYSALPDESKLEELLGGFFQNLFFFFQILENYQKMQQFVF